jgi:hypothetical protein
MIIKPKKGVNEIIISLFFVFIILFAFFRLTNFKIFTENFREKVLTYDMGFSRWHNISEKESSELVQFIGALKRFPSIFYKNVIGYERAKIDSLTIDIEFLDYQKILSDRERAIKDQILHNPTSVKARINYRDKNYKADIRLKGDLSDHWTSVHRLSLRVKLKGDNTIFGLSEFNIQKPRTRSFPYDAIFQDTIRSAGNLASEHNYIKVNVNGSPWGVMNLESHIDKEFLERNKKKESLVVRFSNEDGWLYQKISPKLTNKFYRLSDPILFSKAYSSKKKFDRSRREIYTYIVEQRIKKNEKLYDSETYLRLLLLSKLWGDIHTLYENNTKHYFNPYSLELEPISSDQFQPKILSDSSDSLNLIGQCQIGYSFVMNEVYQRLKNTIYNADLPDHFELILKKLDLIDDFSEKHHNYFPLDKKPNIEVINNNVKTAINMKENFLIINDECYEKINEDIVNEWRNSKYSLFQHVQGFHYENGIVNIYNLLPDDISLLGIRIDQDIFIPINKNISGHNNDSYIAHSFNTNLPGLLDDRIEIVTKYQDEVKYQKLYKTLLNNVKNPLLMESAVAFDFLVNKDESNWVIEKGNWLINSPMIIKGNLIIKPGARLFFSDNAYLAVNGALLANGTLSEEITFTSQNQSWMGIYVYESDFESILNNVKIRNTSSINDGLLKLSGGVNFYKADTKINNSQFISSNAEDMINVVESKFLIENSYMNNAISDAIDIDFSKGEINNLFIENIGGDGIDSSGSDLNLVNISAYKVGDKGISAGESSKILISKCNLDSLGVGIASKDGSLVEMTECHIQNTQLAAVMTYVKKSFYDNPSLFIRSSNLDTKTKFIRQKDSILSIDGKPAPYSKLDVNKLYSSTFMKK